jgi:(p)ppGpp synthase/HD superfamily hydrolase
MQRLGEAIALAADVHRGQMDKAGQPYILHALAVMERARDYYLAKSDGWKLENVMIAAVLHDVLEDLEGENSWDRGRLACRIYGTFGSDVYAAVDALTKRPPVGTTPLGIETYDEYLNRVEKNWIARVVKIADLSHNLDAFRIPSGKIGDYEFKRWDKYHRALVRLIRVEVHPPAPVA